MPKDHGEMGQGGELVSVQLTCHLKATRSQCLTTGFLEIIL